MTINKDQWLANQQKRLEEKQDRIDMRHKFDGKDQSYIDKVLTIETELGYEICAAANRDLVPCKLRAGQGTDHLGEGRCKFHGGRNQSINSGNWKGGKHMQVKGTPPALQAKMDELAVDHEYFDLRQEILKLRAIMDILAERDELLQTAKLAVDVSKIIERLHNIEVGRRYVISIENVSTIIRTVQEVIFRHVPDEFTRHLIAQELQSVQLTSALPAPKIIEPIDEK